MVGALKNRIKGIPSWVFWTGGILLGLLIIIFNDVAGESESFIVFGLFYFIFFILAILRWIFTQIRSIITLKRDRTRMEMLHLKSQVNPHFFFNTLNNLYGLVEKDSQKAQELILKLSDLMRYSIYEGQNDWVTLEEEVSYLRNYVELHKDRYHKKVTVDFATTIDKQGYKIMPLLLILLVENAFKHGVEKLRDDAFVNIKLTAINNQIDFSIANNYDPEEDDQLPGGIGISNLKRRLEIGYQKDFELSIAKGEAHYQAELSIYKV